MNEFARLTRWHDIINSGKTKEEIKEFYKKKMLPEEREELDTAITDAHRAKEACDVIVVCWPLRDDYLYDEYVNFGIRLMERITGSRSNALKIVNDSNFSKLILPHEVDEAMDHFEKLGIEVVIQPVDEDYYGAFSRRDQTVNGKEYVAGKLLKGPNYFEINESVEWWK